MKKALTTLATLALVAGTTLAQAQTKMAPVQPGGKMKGHGMKQDKMMKDCCMMKDGKMMMMKDGKMMPMTSEMTMANGTKCLTDGTCMMKDGTKMMMKDGQCMMMDGSMKDGDMKMHHDKGMHKGEMKHKM